MIICPNAFIITFSPIPLCKDTNKRARNMKLASIFFTASESILEVYLKNTNNKSEKYKVYLVFFAASESILLFCGRIGNKARMQ